MKPRLAFEIHWENPPEARGAELRATWARLVIRVKSDEGGGTQIQGSHISQLLDLSAGARQDGPYLPLYPLAE